MIGNNILEYNDHPLLFLAQSEGKLLLCISQDRETYLCVESTEEWLEPFFKRNRDLLDTIKYNPIQKFYRMTGYLGDTFAMKDVKEEPIENFELPEEGYYMGFDFQAPNEEGS